MDARSGDARMRRAAALRTRLLRHSAVADALLDASDDAVESSPLPPPRRVAGQRPSERRAAVAGAAAATREPAAAREPTAPGPPDVGEPPARRWDGVEPGADELIPFYRDDPGPPRLRSTTARRVIVAGCAVAVLAGAGTAGYLLTHRPAHHSTASAPSGSSTKSGSPARSQPPVSPSVRQAEAWIRANLPKSARLHSNAAVTASLVAGGYSSAGLYTSIDAQGPGTYLVTTPDIRDRAARSWDAADQRIAPLPVVAFGTGEARVDVTLLIGGSASSLSHRLIQDDGERRAADRALLGNPHVQLDPDSRSQLADGQVDLRAATLVALLASRTDVRLTRVSADAGERAVDRPARTITLTLTDPAALDAVLPALPVTYRPARTTVLPSGERQLTWAVGLAPAGL
jgi:hypothetical protein